MMRVIIENSKRYNEDYNVRVINIILEFPMVTIELSHLDDVLDIIDNKNKMSKIEIINKNIQWVTIDHVIYVKFFDNYFSFKKNH